VVASSEGAGAAKETRVRDSVVTTPFHLAIPVHDIHAAREFFGGYSYSHHVHKILEKLF